MENIKIKQQIAANRNVPVDRFFVAFLGAIPIKVNRKAIFIITR